MAFHLEIVDTLTKVKRDFLDDNSHDPVFSYEWILALEESLPIRIQPRHIVITNNGGHIVAFLPCFLQFEELYSSTEDRIFGRLKPWVQRLGVKLFPALLSYAPLMYKSELITIGESGRKETIKLVLAAMDQIAFEEKVKIYGFGYLSPNQSVFMDLLKTACYVGSLVVPNTYVEIGWQNFEGYIDYLKKNHRHMGNNVRREMAKTVNCGIKIERLTDFSSLTERFARQFANTYFRHTRQVSPLTVDFFNELAANCRGVVTAYCAFKGDELRSFALILEGKDIWHLVLSGQDYDQNNKDHSYFYVCFYEPIKEAIARKARRFYFGPANYQAKLRRGCRLEPLYMYVKSPKKATNVFLAHWFKVTEKWYQHKYKDLIGFR